MWLWLQKRLPKTVAVWARLFLFSSTCHLVLLFIIFVLYKGGPNTFNFEISKGLRSDAAIVFMPLQKRVKNPANGQITQNAQQTAAVAEKNKEQNLPQEKSVENKEQKAPVQKTTFISPREQKKLAEKKKKLKLAADKKKAEAKKLAIEKKLKEEKLLKDKEAKTLADKLAKKDNEQQAVNKVSPETLAQEDVRYVGREDLDALHMQEFISSEVGQHWNPPIGIPQNAECEIKLTVDWEGKLKDFHMIRASNIVVYDVAAKNAVKKMSFPKWLWGKDFSITFKQ